MNCNFDNPFNPFTQFDKWLEFDNDKNYGTASLLARISRTSDSLTDEENNAEIERAIDQIIQFDFANMYRKVRSSD